MAENHVHDHVNGVFGEDDEFTECGRFSMLDALARRDEQGRTLVLDRFERALKRWRERAADPDAIGEDGEAQKQLRGHLWSALALRWNAPFVDIRVRMAKLLEDAKVRLCGRCKRVYTCNHTSVSMLYNKIASGQLWFVVPFILHSNIPTPFPLLS